MKQCIGHLEERNDVSIERISLPSQPRVGGRHIGLSFPLGFAQNSGSVFVGKNRDRHDYAEFAKVPDTAREHCNPMESDPEAIIAGRKLFLRHCAECHGDTAEGGRKAPSLRCAPVQNATPGTLFWIISNGVVRRGMPVWSKLPEPQRWQIVTFLKSFSTNQ